CHGRDTPRPCRRPPRQTALHTSRGECQASAAWVTRREIIGPPSRCEPARPRRFAWNRLRSMRKVRYVLILILCVLVGSGGTLLPQHLTGPPREDPNALPRGARYLAAAYGPARYSQFAEEWIIRDFFQDRRNGVFVDVGANHYRDSSTT